MSSASRYARFPAGCSRKGGHFGCYAKISVVFSPLRRTWTRLGLAGWQDGEPWVYSGPYSPTDHCLSWLPMTRGAHVEGHAYRRQATALPVCKRGCGPAAPAESAVSRASYPMQDACLPESRPRRWMGSQALASRSRAPPPQKVPPAPVAPVPSST